MREFTVTLHLTADDDLAPAELRLLLTETLRRDFPDMSPHIGTIIKERRGTEDIPENEFL